jgi:hypothetical protein
MFVIQMVYKNGGLRNWMSGILYYCIIFIVDQANEFKFSCIFIEKESVRPIYTLSRNEQCISQCKCA